MYGYEYGFGSYETNDFFIVEGTPYPKWASSRVEDIRTRRAYPYNYSTFLLKGPMERYEDDNINSAYSDRMRQWDPEAYARAWAAVAPTVQVVQLGLDGMSKWLTAYYNKPCRCLQIFESCNQANGYPLWYFVWEE